MNIQEQTAYDTAFNIALDCLRKARIAKGEEQTAWISMAQRNFEMCQWLRSDKGIAATPNEII